ncbi:MAG: hypothetical protein ACRERE_13770 [Candidatus Entotheonellia bacterium]
MSKPPIRLRMMEDEAIIALHLIVTGLRSVVAATAAAGEIALKRTCAHRR